MKLNHKTLILGNWKMNKTSAEAKAFNERIDSLLSAFYTSHNTTAESFPVGMGIAPTFTSFSAVDFKNVALLSQNVSSAKSGAYTSQISIDMLKDNEVSGSLIGHSECRKYLFETDQDINKKVHVLLQNNLTAILCIGETLEEFESGNTIDVVKKQIEIGLTGVTNDYLRNVVIAYEPVWAIGTGKVATNDIIKNVFAEIKNILTNMYGNAAYTIKLVYGGSANEKNSIEILAIENVDGVLVGGASLDADKFMQIFLSAPDCR